MSTVSLNNSVDIVATCVSIIRGNSVIDLLDTVNDIKGFAPDAVDSLGKLASAVDNNPDFCANVALAIDQKADTSYAITQLATKASSSSVYTESDTDNKLNLIANQETTYTNVQVDTTFANLVGTTPQVLTRQTVGNRLI